MRHRQLGRTNLMVSEMALGALEMGRDWGIRISGNYGRPDEASAIRTIRDAIDAGINFIDTAPAYQLSEERVGRAVEGQRDSVYLATKVGEHYNDERGFWYDYGREEVARSIEQSLRRLQTDHIDLLQIHSASVEIIERGETLEVMQRYQREGHVRFLGMTGGNDAALAAIRTGEYDTVQVVYNILDQSAASEVFPAARDANIGVIVMVPLAQGALTDKWTHLSQERQERIRTLQFLLRPGQTLSQAALRFVLASPAVSCAIAGSRSIDNIRSNINAAQESLSPDDLARIRTLYERDFSPDE